MENFLNKYLVKKEYKIDQLVTKGKGEFTKQDLLGFVSNSDRFGYLNGSVFLLFSEEDKQILKKSVDEELDEQGFAKTKSITKKLRSKLPTKRPVVCYQNFLTETNFIGVEKDGNFLCKWPNSEKQFRIVDKVKELLDENIALKEKKLVDELNNSGFRVPTLGILQKIIERCGEDSIVISSSWITIPARTQIINLSKQFSDGIPQKKLLSAVQGFKIIELKNILRQLVSENKVHVKNNLVFLGPPPPLKNQILQVCQDYQKIEFKNLMNKVVGSLEDKNKIFEKLLSDKKIYSYREGKKTIVCFGELPTIERQITKVLEKFGGISWKNLKKRVIGYSEEELQKKVRNLHKSEKIYVNKENKIFLGKLDRINSDDTDSIKNQIKKIENIIKEFKHSIKPKKDKIFGEIYPECNVIAQHSKELFDRIEKFYADYSYQTNSDSFQSFIKNCWSESKKIMARDNEDFSPIWEIRGMMNYPKKTFDQYLKKMEEDGYIYFVVNNDPSHTIPQKQLENSLKDSRGVLFYIAWRKSL